MAQIKFYLKNPNETNSSIFARFPFGEPTFSNEKIKYSYFKYYISENINPLFWNTKTCRAKNTAKFSESAEFNQRLNVIESLINTVLLKIKNEGLIMSKVDLKIELDKCVKNKIIVEDSDKINLHNMNIIQFTQHLIDTLPLKNSTLMSYKVVKKNLNDFEKIEKTNLTFKNTDIDFYNSFVKYLTGLGLGKNTIGTRIKIIKTILNQANDRGISVSMDYKKKSFSKPKEETECIYLNETELTKINELTDLPKYLDSVRDMFLIGSYTGLRFSDLFRLTKGNITPENTISIKTEKTEKIIDVPIHPHVKKIFEKYNFQLPKPITNQKFNEYIKIVAKRADICDSVSTQFRLKGVLVNKTEYKYNMISSHTARRSFASNAFLADVPTLSIMKITGHKTESAFMKYIKMSSKDNAMKLKTHKFFNPMQIAK